MLTAAHCSHRNNKLADVVVVGDHNLNSNVYDDEEPQEFGILEFIKHEDYSFRYFYYDIALIKLDRNARFTQWVRPACLWQDQLLNFTSAVATGYGWFFKTF